MSYADLFYMVAFSFQKINIIFILLTFGDPDIYFDYKENKQVYSVSEISKIEMRTCNSKKHLDSSPLIRYSSLEFHSFNKK